MRKRTAITVGTVLALALSACTPVQLVQSDSASLAGEALVEQAPAGFEQYYGQEIDFQPCDADQVTLPRMSPPKALNRYRCATVTAPMNWDDPDSAPIELAMAIYGTNDNQPNLFFNLGGPGGDAVQSLSSFVELMVPAPVVDNYQIVAVDPRGVGASSPVSCWDDEGRDQFLADSDDPRDLPLDELVATAHQETADLYAQCLERTGELLNYVDTDSAARDFDMIRAALGIEQLDYLGYSYGTQLGATYADLFPARVGRFVLDSAVDPALGINEVASLQAGGMEESLAHWIEVCQQDDDCPVTGGVAGGQEQLAEFLDSLKADPLPTDSPDRPLTAALGRTGIIGSLYSPESYPLLKVALQLAFQGDGSMLLLLADFYNGREDDGSYNNSQDAFLAVNGLDYAPEGTPEEWQAEAERLAEDYPVLGSSFGYASAGMDAWTATPRVRSGPVRAEGSAPILVIGTTHDPATPYVMAEGLVEQLANAVLLTYDGWGHGAYQQGGSECVLTAVNQYLLQGQLPPDGTVCQ